MPAATATLNTPRTHEISKAAKLARLSDDVHLKSKGTIGEQEKVIVFVADKAASCTIRLRKQAQISTLRGNIIAKDVALLLSMRITRYARKLDSAPKNQPFQSFWLRKFLLNIVTLEDRQSYDFWPVGHGSSESSQRASPHPLPTSAPPTPRPGVTYRPRCVCPRCAAFCRCCR